jgi:hypothetical protein
MTVRAITMSSGLMLAMLAWTLAGAADKHPTRKGPVSPQLPEAPTGFDNKSNGMVDDQTHQADQ